MKKEKEKKIRKAATKGVKKVKKESEILNVLKPEHLKYLEDSSTNVYISSLERVNLEQIIKNKHLELELIKRDIEVNKSRLAEKEMRYKNMLGGRSAFIKGIQSLYGVTAKFSYDPKSGTIVRD